LEEETSLSVIPEKDKNYPTSAVLLLKSTAVI
jgi:hypothetical protein